MTMVTYEMLVEWRACYLKDDRADLLRRLFAEPVSIRDVLTRQDGEWATVPTEDRIWVATRPGVLPDRVLRLAACDIAERALLADRAAGREPHADSWAAIEVGRRHATGEATDAELAAASAAAWDAASAAARAAAWDAARAAAWDAAWDAASAAASVAARDSAWAAAWDASIASIVSRLDEHEAARAAKGGE